MKTWLLLKSCMPLLAFLLTGSVYAGHHDELQDPRIPEVRGSENHAWDYHGSLAPQFWGLLAGNATCGHGMLQSPIAIEPGWNGLFLNVQTNKSPERVVPKWQTLDLHILNNGHTVQVVYDPGSTLEIDGIQYTLAQYHFHSPSEHVINGQHFPMEAHFVHKGTNVNGKKVTAVLAVPMTKGAFNPELEKLWKYVPRVPNGKVVSIAGVKANPSAFLPRNLSYFKYVGSLTTPPCSQNITWIVSMTAVTAAQEQLRFLQRLLGATNNRPIHPSNSRIVEAAYFK